MAVITEPGLMPEAITSLLGDGHIGISTVPLPGTVYVAGMVTGSRMIAKKVANGETIYTAAEGGGIASFSTKYDQVVQIEVRKASAAPFYKPWITQVTPVGNSSITVIALQELDE